MREENSCYPNRIEKDLGLRTVGHCGQTDDKMKIRRFQVKVCIQNSETPVLSLLFQSVGGLFHSLMERKEEGSFLEKPTSPIENTSWEKINSSPCQPAVKPATCNSLPCYWKTSSQPWMFSSWMIGHSNMKEID